jgi:transcription initiation factor TFIIIB Brf1 subunit/transcription initiation factor TFIIB
MASLQLNDVIFNDTDDDWMALLQDISNSPDDDISHELAYLQTKKDTAENLEVQLQIDKVSKFNVCPKCNIEGINNGITIVCEECGLELSESESHGHYSYTMTQDHNTSNNSFMSFNFIGKNSYCYQRSFLKTCANYSSYRKNNNRKDLYNYNYQYEGNKLPKNVIKLAIELFSIIKEHGYVFRGCGKRGVLGSVLYYAANILHVTKTPREIANIMNIEDRFLSHGDRIVQELNELGIINIPNILRPLDDYVNQYFSALQIPIKYKGFVIDLINRAEDKNIHIRSDSRTTTKAIGAIYLLSCRSRNLKHITKEKIVKECMISKSTFVRYANLLRSDYKIIKCVFIKHNIPMENSWQLTKKVTNEKVTKAKVTKAKVTKAKVTKAKVTNEKVTNEKVTKAKVTKAKVTKAKVTKAKVTKAKVTKAKVTKAKVTKAKVTKEII